MHEIPASFDTTELFMEQRELGSLNVTELAVEATPIDGKIENVLKWRLIFISHPQKFPGKIRTVTFEVGQHPIFGDNGMTCVLLKGGSCVDLDVGLRTDKFWWRTKLRRRPGGLITPFSEIINYLEDRHRFESQVDSETLEGTYFWVWEQLRVLDMGGYLVSTLLPGGYIGEYQSALGNFADAVSWWKPAYDLVITQAKERIVEEALVKLKTEQRETEARSTISQEDNAEKEGIERAEEKEEAQ